MTRVHVPRLLLASLLAVAVGLAGPAAPASASDGWSNVIENQVINRTITYPVDGEARYTDTWLAPRSSGRRHLGVDMMGDKLTPLVAANAGCITYLKWGGPGGGNMLTLEDEEGWQYRYIHINNDTPGTDDGANPYEWAFEVHDGQCVEAGERIAYMGDSGNAESTGAHLHFEIRRNDGNWVNPYPPVKAAQDRQSCTAEVTNPAGLPHEDAARGYWMLDDGGHVHGFDAPHLGDLRSLGVTTPPASMSSTPSGEGYWIVDKAGHVHNFGDAAFHGDMRGTHLNGPIRRIEPHPFGDGYWLVADDGGVFTFGNAEFHGSMGAAVLNAPVISLNSTPDGDGYYLVAADGGVFTFGNAEFRGSTSDMQLAASVIDMAVPDSGDGYWLYGG
ncbi:MAG: M23 family metallopeptidase, partial [Actinomycetota bacterium]|nr:M23 family metallopeptidase [Actinomycetota bacterium]